MNWLNWDRLLLKKYLILENYDYFQLSLEGKDERIYEKCIWTHYPYIDNVLKVLNKRYAKSGKNKYS